MELMKPSAVGFNVNAVHLRGPDAEPLDGFSVEDRGDYYELVLGPKSPTTNVPIGTWITLGLIYMDADGKPFRFEDQTPPALHLYYTSKLTASCSKGSTSIGPDPTFVRGHPDRTKAQVDAGADIGNWRNNWEKTGGMEPIFACHAGANDEEVSISIEVPMAGIRDKPLRFRVS
jgi:hypothetical protein